MNRRDFSLAMVAGAVASRSQLATWLRHRLESRRVTLCLFTVYSQTGLAGQT